MKKNLFSILVIIGAFCITPMVFANEDKNEINVSFDNLIVNEGSVSNNTIIIGENINFNILLKQPGDYYSFEVDVKNNGINDIQVSNVVKGDLTDKQLQYITYDVTYIDGNKINIGDIISSGEIKKIKVFIQYKENVSSTNLPNKGEKIIFNFDLSFTEVINSSN